MALALVKQGCRPHAHDGREGVLEEKGKRRATGLRGRLPCPAPPLPPHGSRVQPLAPWHMPHPPFVHIRLPSVSIGHIQ